jgi:hypothetical protein
MGLISAISQFLKGQAANAPVSAESASTSQPVVAAVVEPVSATLPRQTRTAIPHWPRTGTFAVEIVGESYRRDAIEQIAGNGTENALVFCTAKLVPDNHNLYDDHAVAIYIEGSKVGHLSREAARVFRQSLQDSDLSDGETTCDAVIRSGGTFNGRQYDYRIELDFRLGRKIDPAAELPPTYPDPTPASTEPVILNRTDSELFILIQYVEASTMGMCSPGCGIVDWTAPERDDIHWYAPGSVGGTGRLAVLPKARFPQLKTDLDRFPYLTAYKIDGHVLVVRAGLEPDSRFAYAEKGAASIVVLQIETADSEGHGESIAIAAQAYEVELPGGKLVRPLGTFVGDLRTPNSFDTDALAKLLEPADVLVAQDGHLTRTLLAKILPGTLAREKVWAEAGPLFKAYHSAREVMSLPALCQRVGVALPDQRTCQTDCQVLADALFSHTGKTKRSRTYMSMVLLGCRC